MLTSIDDLDVDDIAWIEATASAYAAGAVPERRTFTTGLLFMTQSLRTQLGFAVATARLGGTAIDVHELRWGPGMSDAESLADTLRTMSGMVDIVVARTSVPLDRAFIDRCCVTPFVNAGDGGGEHPTQALIDLCAIVAERGDVAGQRIGICGDLTSRCARSLVKLLDRRRPRELALFAPAGRDELGVEVTADLARRISWRKPGDIEDLDVLYLSGLPAGDADGWVSPEVRQEYAVTAATLDRLRGDAVVLSPMPVIDEISTEAWADPRVRVFAQSDRGVHVRTALLARLLDGTGL